MDKKPRSAPNKAECSKKIKTVENHKSHTKARVLSHPLRQIPCSTEPLRESNKNLIIRGHSPKRPKPPPIALQKNYIKKIERKVQEVKETKSKHFKDPSELPIDCQITLEHKITKHMNFPVEKKIYKQLISLNLSEKEPSYPSSSSSYEPTVKDRCPKIENYFCPKFCAERPIPVSVDLPKNSLTRSFDGLRTSKIEKTWKKCECDIKTSNYDFYT